jgi:MinD superfamily P-loop ATPase
MKEIVILSGKGGTGKTTVTASLAFLSRDKIMADCDVDAPDLHLLMEPKIRKTLDFRGGADVKINKENCTECGLCRELCRFHAIDENLVIDDFLCEGCGLCFEACPVQAITMETKISGKYYISDSKYGKFVHAQLSPGEENSGRLSSEVKNLARDQAVKDNKSYIIIDGPPGIGCPVIASLSGANLTVIVTEPTPSGISDLKRVVELANFFGVESKIIVNKFDINLERTREIEVFCAEKGIELIGKLPFSKTVVDALQNSRTIVEYAPESDVAKEIKSISSKLFASQ